jgi:hypothetical protein
LKKREEVRDWWRAKREPFFSGCGFCFGFSPEEGGPVRGAEGKRVQIKI